MLTARRELVVLLLTCMLPVWAIGPAWQQETPGTQLRPKFQSSVGSIRFLKPNVFSAAPVWVRRELETLGCRIPQAASGARPHNLISGAFAAKGQTDWAALCERGGKLRIVLLWGGPQKCAQQLAETGLADGMQLGATGEPEFSRIIETASPAQMERTWKAFKVEKPVLPRHSAIEDIFVEKASTFEYCENGVWLKLPGGD